MGDAQGNLSRPVFDFVHSVDDAVPNAHDFSEFKTKDGQNDTELKSEIEKLKSKQNVEQKYNDCKLNKENEQERKQVIKSQENLRNDIKMKSMKIENMSSKSEMTKKKCDSNLNDEKN